MAVDWSQKQEDHQSVLVTRKAGCTSIAAGGGPQCFDISNDPITELRDMLELYDANESVIWPDGMNAKRARLQLSQIDTPSATAGSPQSDQGCRLEQEMVGEPISAGEARIAGQEDNREDITAWIRDVRAKYSINTAADNSVTIGRGGDDYSVQAVAIQDSISTAVANSVTIGRGSDVISSQADAF